MLRCEGGWKASSGGSSIETTENSTSGSRLDAREIEERRWCRRGFGCHRGFTLSFHSGGEVSDLSENGRRGDENES